MRRFFLTSLLLVLIPLSAVRAQTEKDEGWITLFDGTTLEGWQASENPETFQVEDGAILVSGARAHLFYVGDVQQHDFTDFEFTAEVLTRPGANSGIYFHTAYQEEGWPAKGYEAQVNNSQGDPRRTGSLYAVQDVAESPVVDDEWFEYYIRVQGNEITLRVGGQTTVVYAEPAEVQRPADMEGRILSSGTFALQGHDPESVVLYRNIRVRPL